MNADLIWFLSRGQKGAFLSLRSLNGASTTKSYTMVDKEKSHGWNFILGTSLAKSNFKFYCVIVMGMVQNGTSRISVKSQKRKGDLQKEKRLSYLQTLRRSIDAGLTQG